MSTRWFLILFLLLLGVVQGSCAPVQRVVSSNDVNWPRASAVLCWRGHTVSFPEGANAERVAAILSAVDYTITEFEKDEKAPIAPVSIGVTDKPAFSCGDDPKEVYQGCWCRHRTRSADGRTGVRVTILVYAADDTLPALYHEFYHAAYWGWGHGEDTPQGRARWAVAEMRGQQVVDRIRKSRLR